MKFKVDELFDCDALLLGRVTYQGFARPGRPWAPTTSASG